MFQSSLYKVYEKQLPAKSDDAACLRMTRHNDSSLALDRSDVGPHVTRVTLVLQQSIVRHCVPRPEHQT